jgi:hypothetical protein
MIEPAIPGKETVRITFPTRRSVETISEPCEGGRINSLIQPCNDIVASGVVARTAAEPLSAGVNGARPDAETSRVSVLPTQAKASARIPTIVRNTVENRASIDAVPKPLCWALVGVSAGVLLVEIWNYIS